MTAVYYSHSKTRMYIKGLVNPKRNILLNLTLKLFQTWDSFLCWTQKIFWRMLVAKQLTVATYFYSMEK